MHAITHDRYGESDVLRWEEVPVPTPKAGEVLVHVHAAAVDRGTWHLMTGLPLMMRPAFGLRGPRQTIPGRDVAGTVVAVGAGVTRFAIGDAVHGAGIGTLAEYACARESKLAPWPAVLDAAHAAAVPISGLTAIQAVRSAAVQPGQRVLITGASGGVGTYAVQIAVAAGGDVTGVCSADKADLVLSLGARAVVDYATTDPLAVGAQPYDVIIDIAGHAPLRRLRSALTKSGTLVIVGSETSGRWTGGFGRSLRAPLLSLFVSQRLTMLASKEIGTDVTALDEMIVAGQVRPSVDRSYPMADAAEAMRDLAAGRARGKLALTTH